MTTMDSQQKELDKYHQKLQQTRFWPLYTILLRMDGQLAETEFHALRDNTGTSEMSLAPTEDSC